MTFSALLLSIFVWLGINTDYDVLVPIPQIVFEEQVDLHSKWLAGYTEELKAAGNTISKDDPAYNSKIEAFYDTRTQTIHLTNDFDTSNIRHQEYLVHEVVHYLQDISGKEFQCPAKKEEEAYAIGTKWQKEHGGTEWKDRMFVLFNSMCDTDLQ